MMNADFLNPAQPSEEIPTPPPQHTATVGPVAAERGGTPDLAILRSMREHWRNGKVVREVWLELYGSLLHGASGGADVALAAELADVAYFHWLRKQNQ